MGQTLQAPCHRKKPTKKSDFIVSKYPDKGSDKQSNNKMKPILLSIVIPTRNRYEYARASILTVLAIPADDIELVIQDNSEDDHLKTAVAQLNDHRVRYFHERDKLDMVENIERALAAASGTYVALIGDDDAVLPQIYAAASWCLANNVDILTPTNAAHYVWPDLVMVRQGAMRAGELRVEQFSSARRFVTGSVELQKCLESGGVTFAGMPRLYYGIVKRECLTKIKNKSGAIVPGVSPDMATSVALSLVATRCVHLDYPIFLPGSSGRSMAGLGGLGKHIGELSEQSHLPKSCVTRWSPMIPSYFSVETIWAHATVEALIKMGEVDLLKYFNRERLFAYIITFHRGFRLRACSCFFSGCPASKLVSLARLLRELLWLFAKRLGFFVARLRPKKRDVVSQFQGVPDVNEAVKVLNSLLHETSPNLDRCFSKI
jgi:glycosyltransferase involved in cell wall biosynthesis